ncbi:MAG: FctA domain-containing protein [Lachnospiraceae bacterium]
MRKNYRTLVSVVAAAAMFLSTGMPISAVNAETVDMAQDTDPESRVLEETKQDEASQNETPQDQGTAEAAESAGSEAQAEEGGAASTENLASAESSSAAPEQAGEESAEAAPGEGSTEAESVSAESTETSTESGTQAPSESSTGALSEATTEASVEETTGTAAEETTGTTEEATEETTDGDFSDLPTEEELDAQIKEEEDALETKDETAAVTGTAKSNDTVIVGYAGFPLEEGGLSEQAPEIDGYTFNGGITLDGVEVSKIFSEVETTDEERTYSVRVGEDDKVQEETVTRDVVMGKTKVTKAETANGTITISGDSSVVFTYDEDHTTTTLTAEYVDAFGDPIDANQESVSVPFAEGKDEITLKESFPEKLQVAQDESGKKVKEYTFESTYIRENDEKVYVTAVRRVKTGDGYAYEVKKDGSDDYTELSGDTTLYVQYSDGQKAQYTYSDVNVTVTATLQHAGAIPDDARFIVTQVTPATDGYNYDAYMDALNGSEEDAAYDESNTLLYDIAFLGYAMDADGSIDTSKTIEYQPAEGSVKIDIQFHKNQLSGTLGADEDSDVTVTHLPLKDEVKAESDTTKDAGEITADDVEVETLPDANVSVDDNAADFTADSFSVFGFTLKPNLTWSGNYEPTIADFSENIGKLTYYAVVAKNLNINSHVEGNVRVGNMEMMAAPNLDQGDTFIRENSYIYSSITVTKTVTGKDAKDGTFSFVVCDGAGNALKSFDISTSGLTGSVTLTKDSDADIFKALDEGQTLHVYEKDKDGNVLPEGGKNGDYTVSYSYADGEDGILQPTGIDNYIGRFTLQNSSMIGFNELSQKPQSKNFFGDFTVDGGDVLVTDGNGHTLRIQNGAGKIEKQEGLEAAIDREVDDVKGFSRNLADSRSGASTDSRGVSVINLVSSTGSFQGYQDNDSNTWVTGDLDEAGINNFNSQVSSLGDGYLLVNIAIDKDKYPVYSFGTQGLSIDGIPFQGNGYSELGSRVIFNFVDENHEPYTGTIRLTSWTTGLLIAPGATIGQSSNYLTGEAIADTLIHKGMEIHKKVLDIPRSTWVSVGNNKDVVKVTIDGTKTLTGGTLTDKKFGFTLTETTEGARDPVTRKAENKSDGSFTFDEISYSEEGEYTYLVTEDLPENATEKNGYISDSVQYDPTRYVVTVKVTKGEDGKLKADVSCSREDGTTADGISFTNIQLTTVSVSKVWKNADSKTISAPEGAEVTFVLHAKAGDKTVSKYDGKTAVLNKDNGWTATWKDLPVEENGTAISYTVTEEGTWSGYTVSYGDNKPYAVNNGTITNTESTAEVTLKAKKELTGRTLQDGEFSFIVTENGNEVSSGTNAADGSITFEPITYHKKDLGEHTYIISEVNDGKAGIGYDSNTYSVTVNVSLQKDGSLKAEETSAGTPVFKNSYTPDTPKPQEKSGSITLHATKKLTGRDEKLKDNEFSFEVKEGDSVAATGTNKADGSITFTPITYQTVGEHTYTIREVAGSAENITYDTKTYRVKVSVTDDGGENLKTKATSLDGDVIFTNTCKPKTPDKPAPKDKSGSITLHATKELTGRDEKLKDNEFSFEVKEGDSVAATGTNKADGSITFTPITYQTVGEHTYIISEVAGGAENIKYDTKTYRVKVSVTDEGGENLKTKATSLDGDVIFTNTCKPKTPDKPAPKDKSGSITLHATKKLNGRDEKLKDNEFSFEVKEGDSVVATGTNKADGSITFTPITYQAVGEHTYTISEVAGSAENITYDTKTYRVKVSVTDDGGENLKTKATNLDGDVIFTNTCKPKTPDTPAPKDKSGSITLHATKELTGRDEKLKDNEFSFEVKEGDSVVATGTNKADGSITFTPITYQAVGEHTYTISEVAGSAENITYDTKTYRVKVSVTDGGGENLKTEATSLDGDVIFTNTYTPKTPDKPDQPTPDKPDQPTPDKPDQPTPDKPDQPTPDKPDQPTPDKPDTPTPDKPDQPTPDKPDQPTPDQPDQPTPDKPDQPTPDQPDQPTPDKPDQPAPDTPSTPDTPTSKSGSVTLTATKQLIGADLEAGDFSFEVTEDGNVVATGTNDASGLIQFSTISYTAAGEHDYSVYEDTGSLPNVTYDTTVYSVHVSVVDEGSDTLTVKVAGADNMVFTNTYNGNHPNGDTPDNGSDSSNGGGGKDTGNTPHNDGTNEFFEEDESDNQSDQLIFEDEDANESDHETEETSEDSDMNVPQTGDDSNLMIWFVLIAMAVMGITGSSIYRKKKDERQNEQ